MHMLHAYEADSVALARFAFSVLRILQHGVSHPAPGRPQLL
jgi:hypothetical protein